MLVNVDGEAFMHPLETRDVSAASIIRECSDDRNEGVETPQGKAVWLDTPMIELIHGEGTIEKRIPAMFRMFMQYGIDMRKERSWFTRRCIIRTVDWKSTAKALPTP